MITKTNRYGEHLSIQEARAIAKEYGVTKLLGSNNKLDKQSDRVQGYILKGLSLAPANLSGYEMCPMRTPDCTKACIGVKSGHNRFNPAKQAKINKTKLFMKASAGFMKLLRHELGNFVKYCDKQDKVGVVRLNTYSDVVWERKFPAIFEEFDDLQFYDYTKIDRRGPMYEANPADWPVNYHLTLSYSGYNWDACQQWLQWGQNVAVVFKDCWDNPLPTEWRGYRVVDGDLDDGRWLEDYGVIVGLRTKGSVKNAGPFFADPKKLMVLNNYYKETK